MKRVILLMCAVAALLSCNKESNLPQASNEIVFDLSASLPDDGSTKAVKTGWETGDVIFVFFSKQATPNYLEMKWTGSKWEMTPHGISLAEDENGNMLGVYLPFGGDASVVKSGSYYVFSPAYYSYYLSSRISYQVQNGKVTGRFNMQVPQGYVQFFVNDADAVDGVASLSDARLKPAGIKHIFSSASISEYDNLVAGDPVPGYVYDKENKTGSEAKGYLFSGILVDAARNKSQNYQFDLVVKGKRYMASKTGTMYTSASAGRAINITGLGWTDVTPQPVDLGLPSGVKWANVNVGAYSEYDYGDFFGWGEVTPYYTKGNNLASGNDIWRPGKEDGYNIPSNRYFWSYKQPNGSYTYYLYKYCNDKNKGIGNYTDALVTLVPMDDAATYNWGNPWRTPTKDEITELIENTDFEWTTLGGSKGCKFMKKDDHSVYIFIPITGRRTNTTYPLGQTALYCMSSSLYTSNPYNAYCLYGYNGVKPYLNYNVRYFGIPVRPVQN